VSADHRRAPIHVASSIEQFAERDAQIVRLKRDGVAGAEIGRRFGISRQRVQQILKRAELRRG
jgi:DNA-binding CsgD family transcriptional regulator